MKTLCIDEIQVTVASHQGRWLYVYSDIERQQIFSFQDEVVDFCLEEGEDSSWLLWVITKSGYVYRLTEKDIHRPNLSENWMSDSQINDAIFEELSEDVPDLGFRPSTEPFTHHSLKDAIFEVGFKGRAICAHEDILVIAVTRKKRCTLNFYIKKDLALNDGPKQAFFSTNLDSPSQAFDDVSLYIVASSANSCVSSTGNLCLEPSVFNSVFGSQTAILDSLVILLTLSNGCVYFMPLKKWSAPSNPNSGLSLFCELNSPITKIFVLSVETCNNNNEEEAAGQANMSQRFFDFDEPVPRFSGLLVCAANGQCGLFSSPDNLKKKCQVMQKTILKNGPIMACCPGNGILQFFYSSSSKIVLAALSFRDQLEVSEKVCTRLARIKDMACIAVKDETFLLCQSEDGQYYTVPTSNEGSSVPKPIVDQNHTIPNLLARIDDIIQKMDQMNPNMKDQSKILSQLALASHFYLKTSEFENHKRPPGNSVQVSVSVKCTNQITALCCQVTSCRIVLSSDWSLVFETHPVASATKESFHKTNFKSMRLRQGLKPKESVEVDIVPNLELPSDTRIGINVWLVLNLQLHDLSFDSPSYHVDQFKILEDQGLAIHIFESQMDFLDFLDCKGSTQNEVCLYTEPKYSTPISLIIDSIAKKKPFYSALEDIPELCSNLKEKLIYLIPVPPHLSAVLSDHSCHDISHKSCLLKDLFLKLKTPNIKEIPGSLPSMTLETSDWGQVTIGIQKASGETNQFFIEIQSGSPAILMEMVLSLMKRIQNLLPAELKKTLDISKFIDEIQKSKENLRSIEEDLKNNKGRTKMENLIKKLLYFYLDVHKIDYHLKCQLHG